MITGSAKNLEGERAVYGTVYTGKFKDRNSDIRTAGILTYASGQNVEESIRQPSISAPQPPTVDKFRSFTDPQLGSIRYHYGKFSDPKYYNTLTHGLPSNNGEYKAKELVNPNQVTNFDQLKKDLSENIYLTHKREPLGKIPIGNLPKHIDPNTHTFGIVSHKSDSAKDLVSPNKSRVQVELETSNKHEMYSFSHKDYEPGEQKTRRFFQSFNKDRTFGLTTPVYTDGRLTKDAMNWLPTKLLDKRNQVESKKLNDFRERNTNQIGQALDPKKETRLVGPDHVFGLTNTTEKYGAADVVHGRLEEKVLKGKERQRAYVAVLRSHLGRHNYTVFKTLVAAFQFYDQDKDGYVNKEELKNACLKTGFPIAEDLLDALMFECDIDRDGRLNFLEFSNFLCFKDSMKTGILFNPNDPEVLKLKQTENSNDVLIKDEDGRPLLKESDLSPKNNIEGNELVPRTISNQIDKKIGTWKTTYDIINEAPFRVEPIKKRVYGVPSIRNDLVAPRTKKIQDKINYGDDGNSWLLLNPSMYTYHGVYERDVLQPRPKQEIKSIFKNIGVDLSDDLFENIWAAASSKNPYGEVSVEEFRSVLDEIKSSATTQLICT